VTHVHSQQSQSSTSQGGDNSEAEKRQDNGDTEAAGTSCSKVHSDTKLQQDVRRSHSQDIESSSSDDENDTEKQIDKSICSEEENQQVSRSEDEIQRDVSHSEDEIQRDDSHSEDEIQRDDSHSEDEKQRDGSHNDEEIQRDDSHSEDEIQRDVSHSEDEIQRDDSHNEDEVQRDDSHSEDDFAPQVQNGSSIGEEEDTILTAEEIQQDEMFQLAIAERKINFNKMQSPKLLQDLCVKTVVNYLDYFCYIVDPFSCLRKFNCIIAIIFNPLYYYIHSSIHFKGLLGKST
jgi:hypothetical protein